MLNKKILHLHFESLEKMLSLRGIKTHSHFQALEYWSNFKLLSQELDMKKVHHKRLSKEFYEYKQQNNQNINNITREIEKTQARISVLEEEVIVLENKLNEIMLHIPNFLLESVPEGLNEKDNITLFSWGEIPTVEIRKDDHVTVGERCQILNIARAVALSGSRSVSLIGEGAELHRAIVQFFLDEAKNNGYEEIFTPYLVHEKNLFGTGQLPKFKDDLFKIEDQNIYLIPTAEVTLTNYYKDRIFLEKDLPVLICGFSSCFRKEAGSYGKDTRGLIRTHQFQKVELVALSSEQQGEKVFENLTLHAQSLLEKLNLPYRKVLLCSGDTGFSAMKTYDLEIYFPSTQSYREISSCSYFGDFQSRRIGLKYKTTNHKNQYIHTINGSGLAVERTLAGILENYQQSDGSVAIPKVLQPYMKNKKIIKRR